MEQRTVKIGNFQIGNKLPLSLISGPCQIESRQHAVDLAGKMVELTKKLGINYVFKASFDKANRTSINGARGVGIEEGMKTFAEIKKLYGCPIVTDVHEVEQCATVAEYVDMLQGRSKDSVHETYIKPNPVRLKKMYMNVMDNVTIDIEKQRTVVSNLL